MQHADFHIGLVFWSTSRPHRPWRCTDVGSRVITAVQIDFLIDGAIDPFYDDPDGLLECVFQPREFECCSVEIPPECERLRNWAPARPLLPEITSDDVEAVQKAQQEDLFG